MRKPRIALIPGDPSGVGPELAVKLLARTETCKNADVYLVAGAKEMELAQKQAGMSITLGDEPTDTHAKLIEDTDFDEAAIELGKVCVPSGAAVLRQFTIALNMAKAGEIDALVFTPLNKASLKAAGMQYQDELRWFATELDFTGFTSEINVLDELVTSRVTSHVPIWKVSEGITIETTVKAVVLLDEVLKGRGIAKPRIGMCGLNPHNGDNGNCGTEEIEIITPAVDQAKTLGYDVEGPFPADTMFATRRDKYDGIVTMYHDQGQIAMKLMGFDRGVTVQGGLPVPISTPASGSAFDIVGKGLATTAATENAFDLATGMVNNKLNQSS